MYCFVFEVRYDWRFLPEGDAFGKDVHIELNLLDILPCQTKMEGIKLEIDDSAYDLVDNVICTIDPEVAFKGCQVAILLG